MMKKLGLLVLTLMLSVGVFAQYYCIPYQDAGKNPGNLNTDAEYPEGGGLPSGWTEIMKGPKVAPVYTLTQTLPFTFEFNGQAVTQYKVSSTGVLTFDVADKDIPPLTNETLPSANIPNSSICVWGIFPAANDRIMTKTFGKAPNRQLWIHFNSFSEENIQSGWTYWSIVLEETTNNIYIVDQRFYCTDGTNPCTNNVALTIGIQVDSANAVMVKGSPNVASNTVNDPTAKDNTYYAFYYGTQLTYDMMGWSVEPLDNVKENTAVNFKGKLKNLGSQVVTTFDLNYQVDSEPVVTQSISGQSLDVGDLYSFSCKTWTPTSAGVLHDIKIWASNINGNTDENTNNDIITLNTAVNKGVSGTKRVVVEEGTGAWCGFCPDGHLVLHDIMENNSNVIGITHHNSDGMTCTGGNVINSTYSTGYPTGYIDRKLFAGKEVVALSRNEWASKVAERLNEPTPIDINFLSFNYDHGARTLDLDIEFEFVDYVYGDIRMSVILIESKITGTGSDYDQRNYYSSQGSAVGGSSHPLYNLPDPIVGYEHNLVSRFFITADYFGDVITVNNLRMYNQGEKINRQVSNFIPVNWDDRYSEIVVLASYYNEDINKREVINAVSRNLYTTDVAEEELTSSVGDIYPNPVGVISQIEFSIEKQSNVSLQIMNSLGQIVKTVEAKDYVAGKQSIYFSTEDLASGSYIAILNIDGQNYTRKFIK